MAKIITSEAYALIRQDIEKVAVNALVFLVPAAIIILEHLIAGKEPKDVLPVLYLYLLNTLLDVCRKFLKITKYATR